MNERKTKIASRIKEFRLEKGWSQLELSRRVGVAKSMVSMWESDQNEPKASYIFTLAIELGVTSDELLGLGESDAKIEGSSISDVSK